MAQDRNTYAKRQRENIKKQKAADKRARRQKRKEGASRIAPAARFSRQLDKSLMVWFTNELRLTAEMAM